MRPRRWDIDNQPVWFLIRSLLVVLEKLLEEEETQVTLYIADVLMM